MLGSFFAFLPIVSIKFGLGSIYDDDDDFEIPKCPKLIFSSTSSLSSRGITIVSDFIRIPPHQLSSPLTSKKFLAASFTSTL